MVSRAATKSYCTDPAEKGRVIAAPLDGDTLGEMVVILHEIAHAAAWDIDEEVIDELAYAQGRALWALGWRKQSE